MIKKIYFFFAISSFILGQLLFLSNKSNGILVFMGMFCPIIMSYLNIEVISWIHNNYGNQATNHFNTFQFVTKSIFMIAMSYVGIKIFNLNFRVYSPTLCTVWFVFHVLEAFYTQSLLNRHK